MSSKGGRRAARRSTNKADRPSRFFMVAMTLGLLVFLFILAQAFIYKDDTKGTFEGPEQSPAPSTTS